MIVTFLFWNINKRPIQSTIANLALRHQIDVIMLAECSILPSIIISALKRKTNSIYDYAPDNNCRKITIYTKFSREYIKAIDDPLHDIDRLTIRHLKIPKLTDILLLVTHFVSKNNWTNGSQSFEWYRFSDKIKWAERVIGHSRTILIGDLNMSPFEQGIISAGGLHGTMSRNIANKKTRTIQGKDYPFFYNPMWNFLGDFNSDTPGTYYYPNAEHESLFWYVFDQVLIRPDLLNKFSNEDLKILTSDDENSFLNSNGIPDKSIASDHLPLLFKLDL